MSKIQTVWVYADAAERYADLIAGARRFGAVVNAVVPCESCAAELRACGPAAVYNLGLAEGEAIENYAETIASLAQGEGNLFLFDATRRSKALAAGVAAKRGAGLVNDALSLEAGDAVKATFRTYGGLAAAAVRIVSADAVVTVGAGVFEPEPADASADIPVIAVEKVAPAAAIVVKERRAKAAASVDLTKAKRVIRHRPRHCQAGRHCDDRSLCQGYRRRNRLLPSDRRRRALDGTRTLYRCFRHAAQS